MSFKQNCQQIKNHPQNITADDVFNQLIQKLRYHQTAVLVMCEWTEIFLSCKQNCRQIKIHRQNITADDKFNQLIQKLCYRQTAVLAQLSSPHLSASSNIGRGQTVCFASTPSYSLVIHSWFWHWIIVFIVYCTSLNSLQIRVLRANHSITNFVSL